MIILINQEINEFLNANALYIALGFIGLIVEVLILAVIVDSLV